MQTPIFCNMQQLFAPKTKEMLATVIKPICSYKWTISKNVTLWNSLSYGLCVVTQGCRGLSQLLWGRRQGTPCRVTGHHSMEITMKKIYRGTRRGCRIHAERPLDLNLPSGFKPWTVFLWGHSASNHWITVPPVSGISQGIKWNLARGGTLISCVFVSQDDQNQFQYFLFLD